MDVYQQSFAIAKNLITKANNYCLFCDFIKVWEQCFSEETLEGHFVGAHHTQD